MYCSNCGKEIDDKAVICVGCGVAVGNKESKQFQAKTGGSKFNTLTLVLSLASIFLTSLVFIFMFFAYSLDIVESSWSIGIYYAYYSFQSWGVILGWILSVLALGAGVTSTVMCFVHKQNTQFRSLLSLILPLLSILFLSLSM